MKSVVKIGAVLIAIAMASMLVLRSCDDKPLGEEPLRPRPKECSIKLSSSQLAAGDMIDFRLKSRKNKAVTDSMAYLDGSPVSFAPIASIDLPLGQHTIKGKYLYEDGTNCEASWTFELRSDIAPEILEFEIVDMFDHYSSAYTQGLVYHEGKIYEGTGQYGESEIYSYAPGEMAKEDKRSLSMNLFGEGITILDDRIYQLTWKAGKGYVYDVAGDDEALMDFALPTAEGWGITDDGTSLIISDGSHVLHYLDPVTFEVMRTQAIYSDKGKVEKLNELEFVNGFIYANVYGESVIAKIDAATGKVVSFVDCRGILPPEFVTPEQDVFNGIAYNPSRGTFYLTGKYWPKMFEVRFLERPAT